MIELKIGGDGIILESQKDGVKFQKYISTNTFKRCILQDYKMDTGMLPIGTIAFKHVRGGSKVAYVQNEAIKDVKYIDEDEQGNDRTNSFKVPSPHLLWIFHLSMRNVVRKAEQYAIKSSFVLPDSELYHSPFANVYADGHICWGDDSFLRDPMKNLVGLSSLPSIFFERAFNNDLNPIFMKGCLMFFRNYDKKKDFPYGYLSYYKLFKEVW